MDDFSLIENRDHSRDMDSSIGVLMFVRLD